MQPVFIRNEEAPVITMLPVTSDCCGGNSTTTDNASVVRAGNRSCVRVQSV